MSLPGLLRVLGPGNPLGMLSALLDREAADLLRRLQNPEGDAHADARRESLEGVDLWYPRRGRIRAAIAVTPGLSELGRQDRRLWQPAAALAGAGFLVMLPDMPGALRMTMDPADVACMDQATRSLAAHPGNPRPGRVAMIAVCCTAAPALLAAARPGSPIRFLLTIGGYFDAEATLTAALTGSYRLRGESGWRHRQPSALATGAFLLTIAEGLADPDDCARVREIGREIMRRRMPDLAACRAALGAEGQAVIALLQEPDPDRVRQRVAALPQQALQRLAAVDPSRADLSGLRSRVLALHGEADGIVPWTESVALSAAVPRATSLVVPGMRHLGEEASLSFGSKLQLVTVMRTLLDWRDGEDAG